MSEINQVKPEELTSFESFSLVVSVFRSFLMLINHWKIIPEKFGPSEAPPFNRLARNKRRPMHH